MHRVLPLLLVALTAACNAPAPVEPAAPAAPVAPAASASAREASGELRRDPAVAAPGREGGPETPPEAVKDAVVAVQTAMKHYDAMVEAMNATEIARLYAPTGEMVNGDTLVARGPAAVREYLQGFDGKIRVERNISRADEVKVEGDEATVRGEYQQRAVVIAEKRAVVARGSFVARWRKQGDGRWLIQRMSTAPPEPKGPTGS